MEEWLVLWLKDNDYVLYAEAKGYYVYENDKYTIVVHEKEGIKIMKPKDLSCHEGRID